jgi:hypothetical protein
MRDRTFRGNSGKKIAGSTVIETLWTAALEQSLGENRKLMRKNTIAELERSLEGNARRATIIEGFDALGEPMSTTTAGGVA